MTTSSGRITFARLLLEIRRRAASTGDMLERHTLREALDRLGSVVAAQATAESEAVRQVIGAMLHVHSELQVEGRALDALTPETVLRLDVLLDALLQGGITENELRAILRHTLIRAVH